MEEKQREQLTQQLEGAKARLAQGSSIRDVVRETGLSKGIVERLRHELQGERAARGEAPLSSPRPGPRPREIRVPVTEDEARALGRKAREAGLELEDYVYQLIREKVQAI